MTASRYERDAMTASRHQLLWLQLALVARGFETGTPDGTWGEVSTGALRAFRARAGLPRAARVGPAEVMRMGLTATPGTPARLARATARAYPPAS